MSEAMTPSEVVAAAIAVLLPGGVDVPRRDDVVIKGPIADANGNAYLEVSFGDETFLVTVRQAGASR